MQEKTVSCISYFKQGRLRLDGSCCCLLLLLSLLSLQYNLKAAYIYASHLNVQQFAKHSLCTSTAYLPPDFIK